MSGEGAVLYARRLAGVVALDLPRYLHALMSSDVKRCLRVHNRQERIEVAQGGVACLWRWTSDLHAPRYLPFLGRWLMQRVLAAHPIRFAAAPERAAAQVAFIIGHRGEQRVPLLMATLASIAAQRRPCVECIVVQQEEHCTLAGRLPSWVKLVHTPCPPSMPFSRAWAFNVGATVATAPVLVLHDNDMLVPEDYAAGICARVAQGFEVVNLKRFIFYLDPSSSQRVIREPAALRDCTPEAVMQNAQGGGSAAITRAAFEEIGGMDESFVGWGGEDNEFWERAGTRKVWPWADLPFVHLWHAAQPRKQDADNPTAANYAALSAVDVPTRIARLKTRARGSMSAPRSDGSEAPEGAIR